MTESNSLLAETRLQQLHAQVQSAARLTVYSQQAQALGYWCTTWIQVCNTYMWAQRSTQADTQHSH